MFLFGMDAITDLGDTFMRLTILLAFAILTWLPPILTWAQPYSYRVNGAITAISPSGVDGPSLEQTFDVGDSFSVDIFYDELATITSSNTSVRTYRFNQNSEAQLTAKVDSWYEASLSSQSIKHTPNIQNINGRLNFGWSAWLPDAAGPNIGGNNPVNINVALSFLPGAITTLDLNPIPITDWYGVGYNQVSINFKGSDGRISWIYGSVDSIQDLSIPIVMCEGFESPMSTYPVRAKKNRVFPLKMELFDGDGFELEGGDLIAPPVVQVVFASASGDPAIDVSDHALSSGLGSDGNQFEFTDDGIWQFNLKSKNYSASGEYLVTVMSGDESEYVIDPACVTSFQVK